MVNGGGGGGVQILSSTSTGTSLFPVLISGIFMNSQVVKYLRYTNSKESSHGQTVSTKSHVSLHEKHEE